MLIWDVVYSQVRCNGLYSLNGSIPDLLQYKTKLEGLCNQIDKLEAFVNRVKQDIDLIETQMDAAEVDIGTNDGKLKNIFRPLFSVSMRLFVQYPNSIWYTRKSQLSYE